ncbi:MAG: hypothetical protein JW915_22570 [Chitinispirillaceae bacterium]|nr:hypothetical protein [Chitinispirillaceae bacterium]
MGIVEDEAFAYDEGDVFKNSTKLQNKFNHVFSCPNSVLMETYFDQLHQTSGYWIMGVYMDY